MKRNYIVNEKIIERGEYTIKFQKEVPDLNHVVVFRNDDHKSVRINSFYVSKDLGNYWYRVLEKTTEGCYLTPLIDLFFLDSIAHDDNYDFYSDVFKDIYGCRPHYTKSEWRDRVCHARSLKPEVESEYR